MTQENIYGERDLLIADDMKKCFKELGLEIHGQMPLDQGILIASRFNYEENQVLISASFYPEVDLMDITLLYSQVPEETIPGLCDLFNRLNQGLVMAYYSVHPDHQAIQLRSMFYVTRYSLDKSEFKKVLNHCLATGHETISLAMKFMCTNETPKSIVDKYLEDAKNMSSEFPGSYVQIRQPQMAGETPYIIHACAEMPAFPTHTHGMTEIEMPEFLMDHLAFGPRGNSDKITLSYKYFKKPENVGMLEVIKQGETIKLTIKELMPDAKEEPRPYCYRRVYPDFHMVKEAYNLDDHDEVGPDTWFIQIYVEGDDFALTDDYYKGGIKW